MRVDDKELITTADYAVRFSGLRVGVPADQLQEWLAAELTQLLTIPLELIAQIEVLRPPVTACNCPQPLNCLL